MKDSTIVLPPRMHNSIIVLSPQNTPGTLNTTACGVTVQQDKDAGKLAAKELTRVLSESKDFKSVKFHQGGKWRHRNAYKDPDAAARLMIDEGAHLAILGICDATKWDGGKGKWKGGSCFISISVIGRGGIHLKDFNVSNVDASSPMAAAMRCGRELAELVLTYKVDEDFD